MWTASIQPRIGVGRLSPNRWPAKSLGEELKGWFTAEFPTVVPTTLIIVSLSVLFASTVPGTGHSGAVGFAFVTLAAVVAWIGVAVAESGSWLRLFRLPVAIGLSYLFIVEVSYNLGILAGREFAGTKP